MKRILFYTLLGITALVAGCSDDLVESKVVRHQGEDIVFGARAGFENANPNIRTIYTDEYYEEGGKKYEGVNWVTSEDIIRIYCAQAVNPAEGGAKYADYKVTNDPSTDHQLKSYATLERYNPAGALQWGANDVTHEFYAVYPAPVMFNGNDAAQVSIEANKVKGFMPVSQTPKSIEATADGGYEAKPDMRYAFMTSRQQVLPNQGGNIDFSFQSIATAVEVSLTAPETQEYYLTDISLSTSDVNVHLCGDFEADLDNVGSDGYPVCQETSGGDATNQVTVSLYNGNVPLNLKAGKTLKVTFFVLPVATVGDLSLTITTTAGSKTLSLNGNDQNVQLKAHMKHLVRGITLPTNYEGYNWVSRIPDNVILSQLSIPGTSSSYSYRYTGSNTDWYKAQTVGIDAQWNSGVRCFEFVSDHDASNLGRTNITCNGQSMGVTVLAALQDLEARVKANPSEFAMVIFAYQPNDRRYPETYMTALNALYDSWGGSAKTALFRPGMTVGEVRGKLLFVARPTSKGEDSNYDGLSAGNRNILIINGWGSLKDKWQNRGYAVDNMWSASSPTTSMEANLVKQKSQEGGMPDDYTPSDFTILAKGEANFTYTTNQNYNAWCQEWARVSPESKVYSDSYETGGLWWKTYYKLGVYWPESYSEKLQDAKATFERAIDDKENASSVYFNSLSGYMIDSKIQNSYSPFMSGYEGWGGNRINWNGGGREGDISKLATRLNGDFYSFVLSKGDGITGPMGVILMDRVDNGGGSSYLPNVIIANNFKFPLITK